MALIDREWNWDPWKELGRFGRELAGLPPRTEAYPAVNVYEAADAYGLEAEVPGVDAASLDLTVEGDTVTLSGELPEVRQEAAFHRRERPVGRFSRAIRFPVRLDPSAVEAHCRDGVLTARLAKAPEAKARKIAVQADR